MALGPDADPESVARKILLDQLTGRARTRHELAAKLAAKGVPDEIAGRLLDRFTEVGLIDDAAFARLWVESRQSGKGLARRALAAELRRKGVADEVVREVLDDLEPGERGGGGAGSGAQEAALAADGRPGHRDPAAGRHAGSQGLSAGPGVRRRPRRAGSALRRQARVPTSPF